MRSTHVASLLLGASLFACSSSTSSDQTAAPVDSGPGAVTDSGAPPAKLDGGGGTGDVDSGSEDDSNPSAAGDTGAGPADDGGSADVGPQLKGLNLSSAEWGFVPGTYGTDYVYPTHAEIDRYTGVNMSMFRIPFLWERMQPTLDADLSATELGYLDDIVTYATGKGAHVIVDPHNYARYDGNVIGSPPADGGAMVTGADLADLWGRLAAHYASNPLVVFGLMNEPHDIDVNTWLAAANASIAAIRAAGAANLILVPGTNWTGAASWTDSNAAMIGTVDPGNNFAFEVHQYLDSDSSGSHTTCVSATIGTERLTSFIAWLQSNDQRGFLAEFGGGAVADTQEMDATCSSALDSMLSLVESQPRLWVGWTYWAGGPRWTDGFSFSIPDNQTPWQLTLLESHL